MNPQWSRSGNCSSWADIKPVGEMFFHCNNCCQANWPMRQPRSWDNFSVIHWQPAWCCYAAIQACSITEPASTAVFVTSWPAICLWPLWASPASRKPHWCVPWSAIMLQRFAVKPATDFSVRRNPRHNPAESYPNANPPIHPDCHSRICRTTHPNPSQSNWYCIK